MSKTETINQKTENIKIFKKKESELILDQDTMFERTKEISEIHDQTIMINEMMKDLSMMVNEQGETIKEISENTKNTRKTAKEALVQIQKTEHKKSWCSIM